MNNQPNSTQPQRHIVIEQTPSIDLIKSIRADEEVTFSLDKCSAIFSSDGYFLYMLDEQEKDIDLQKESSECINQVLVLLKEFSESGLTLELSDSYNNDTFTINQIDLWINPLSTPPNQKEKYYVVSTSTKIGESSNTINHLIQSCDYNLVYSEAEVAQSINNGSFDKDTYDNPCFDVDGFIAFPNSSKEVSQSEFEVLKQWLEIYPVEKDIKDCSDSIIEFVAQSV